MTPPLTALAGKPFNWETEWEGDGFKNLTFRDFPGGAVVKNLPVNAGDTGSIRGGGRSHMPRSS